MAKKRDYKDEYKKFQSSTKSKKYRAELNKYNRDKGTYGNGDGKDASHKGGKIVGFENESKNRGRKEKSRMKKEQKMAEGSGASKEAMGIAGFTGTRGSAVQDFINKHELNAKKLFNFVKKGSLSQRSEFVSAIAGKPGNTIQTKIIKQFTENVDMNEQKLREMIREQIQSLNEKYYFNIGRGIYYMGPDSHKINHKKEVKDGYPNADKVLSTVKQASDYVIKKNKIKEGLNEASFQKGKQYGGSSGEGGIYMGKKGLSKLIKLSKDNPNNTFLFKDDNYSGLKPHWIKNGEIAKFTSQNPNYDFQKSKVRNFKIKNDVILSFKLFEGKLNENNNLYVIAKRDGKWVIFNKTELNDTEAHKLYTRLEKAKIPSIKQIELIDRNQLKSYKLKPIK